MSLQSDCGLNLETSGWMCSPDSRQAELMSESSLQLNSAESLLYSLNCVRVSLVPETHSYLMTKASLELLGDVEILICLDLTFFGMVADKKRVSFLYMYIVNFPVFICLKGYVLYKYSIT